MSRGHKDSNPVSGTWKDVEMSGSLIKGAGSEGGSGGSIVSHWRKLEEGVLFMLCC